MTDGFLSYGRHNISDEDISAVVRILKSDCLVQGPAVDRFEDSLKKYIHSRHAVAVSNATCGLHIAYLAAGIGKGDAVIVPAITFAATANAVLYCGGTPVFADIDAATGNICPVSVERCIAIAKKAGLKVKAIAPVHFAGRPCEMGTLVDIAEKNQLAIIEDACHAIGGEYRLSTSDPFQKVGSADWTSMAVFSFHPVKHVATGEGGAVTTNDSKLAAKLNLLRTHGITKDSSRYQNHGRATENGRSNPWYHEMQELGFNYRMTDIQGALGESQMKRIAANIARRREIAAAYTEAFRGLSHISTLAGDTDTGKHAYHLYSLKIDFKGLGKTRAVVMDELKQKNIGTQVHYIPVCWHPYYEKNNSLWLSDSLNQAALLYDQELSIPMYHSLSDSDVVRVQKAVASLVKN